MAKQQGRVFDLVETKGTFQLQGITTGTQKDSFYSEKETSTGKPMRKVNFGVKYDKEKTAFVTLQGFIKDTVYFSRPAEKKGEKGETEKVAWKDRFAFNKDKFRLIGINLGITKTTDAKGNEVNDKKYLTEYDACKEIGENLTDAKSVFIKGRLEFSHFTADDGGTRRNTNLVPSQISLCKDIDFDKEDFTAESRFTQVIIFTGVEQEKENDKPTDRFVVSAKIITYSNIEDAEFIIADKNLATQMRKNLKPYYAIKVWGNIEASSKASEVEVTDSWGEINKMDRIDSPFKREFVITGADPGSIDKETYTEEAIGEAVRKINADKKADKDFGNVPWGEGSNSDDDGDEAW